MKEIVIKKLIVISCFLVILKLIFLIIFKVIKKKNSKMNLWNENKFFLLELNLFVKIYSD